MRLTTRGYQVQRDDVAETAAFFGKRPVRDLRQQHVEDFLTSLASRGRKGTTRNRYHTSLVEASSPGSAESPPK